MHTRTLAPLAALALALRNVGARMMADRNPDGYDSATRDDSLDSLRGGIPEAQDAYSAIGQDGFAMFGAYGDPRLSPTCDELTGADGFLPTGELPGFGCDPTVAAQWAARQVEQAERVANLASQWGLTERAALVAMSVDAGPDVDTAGACWSTSEGLADTTELSDDTDRYGHLADAHVADERIMDRAIAQGIADGRKAGPVVVKAEQTWAELATERRARFERLSTWMRATVRAGEAQASKARKAGAPDVARSIMARTAATVRTARAKWYALYVESVRACLDKPSDEGRFTTLYLTRDQAEQLGVMPRKAAQGTRA